MPAQRLLTDDCSAFHPQARFAVQQFRATHEHARAFRPQTHGKAERFVQRALREGAHGIPYNHADERRAMLAKWQHHDNWHCPHAGSGGVPPKTRLTPPSDNNPVMLHISGADAEGRNERS